MMKGFIKSILYIAVTLFSFIGPFLVTMYISLNSNLSQIVYVLIYLFLWITISVRLFDGHWIWDSRDKNKGRWSLKALDDW